MSAEIGSRQLRWLFSGWKAARPSLITFDLHSTDGEVWTSASLRVAVWNELMHGDKFSTATGKKPEELPLSQRLYLTLPSLLCCVLTPETQTISPDEFAARVQATEQAYMQENFNSREIHQSLPGEINMNDLLVWVTAALRLEYDLHLSYSASSRPSASAKVSAVSKKTKRHPYMPI